MWRACAWIVLLASLAKAEEPVPKPPAAIAATPPTAKTFEVEGPEEALRVAFEDLDLRRLLSVEEIPVDVENSLPAWLKNLNGKTVRISGWMFPPSAENKLPSFLLVRDGMWMNFGRRHHSDEKIGVRLRQGVTTDYIQDRQFDVVGKFAIKSRVDDGKLIWLYFIEDAVVLDNPRSPESQAGL